MAREALIRKKAIEILEKEKFVYWYPSKVKFQQNDIFGVFDLVCWQKRTTKIKFLQLTSLSNFFPYQNLVTSQSHSTDTVATQEMLQMHTASSVRVK